LGPWWKSLLRKNGRNFENGRPSMGEDADGATAYFHCPHPGCGICTESMTDLYDHIEVAHKKKWRKGPWVPPVNRLELVCTIHLTWDQEKTP
jgi:hypothetical protein